LRFPNFSTNPVPSHPTFPALSSFVPSWKKPPSTIHYKKKSQNNTERKKKSLEGKKAWGNRASLHPEKKRDRASKRPERKEEEDNVQQDQRKKHIQRPRELREGEKLW